MPLAETFLHLKQQTNSITHNPLLNCFDQDDLAMLDNEADTNTFIAEKQRTILNLVAGHRIDFNPKLKSAFDEYSEALTYLRLQTKFDTVDRVSEGSDKTPDFKVVFSDDFYDTPETHTVYAELKSLAYTEGNLNYKETMEQGLNAQIDIERQLQQGNRIAFGITEIKPLHKDNQRYEFGATRYPIEILIDKIAQNLKAGQFSLGETVLIVDLKQIVIPSTFMEAGVAIFQERQYNSFVSGVLWNVAFGKQGNLIYKPIEFEGKENTDGELEKDGILIQHDWVKAIIFQNYTLSDREPKILGLHRQRGTNESVHAFLHKYCAFVNDDRNSNGWRLTETGAEG